MLVYGIFEVAGLHLQLAKVRLSALIKTVQELALVVNRRLYVLCIRLDLLELFHNRLTYLLELRIVLAKGLQNILLVLVQIALLDRRNVIVGGIW